MRLAGLVLLASTLLVGGYWLIDGLSSDGPAERDGFVLLPGGQGPAAPGTVRATDAAYTGRVTTGRDFAETLALAPASAGRMGRGYVITADSNAGMLAGHKMRVGDVILDMDGKPLDPARIAALGTELGQFDAVEVTFVRQGQMRHRLLTFD